jgi:hypothetical protein
MYQSIFIRIAIGIESLNEALVNIFQSLEVKKKPV